MCFVNISPLVDIDGHVVVTLGNMGVTKLQGVTLKGGGGSENPFHATCLTPPPPVISVFFQVFSKTFFM